MESRVGRMTACMGVALCREERMEWRISREGRSSSREGKRRIIMDKDTDTDKDKDMWRSSCRRACRAAEDTRACHMDKEWREARCQEERAECGRSE